MKLRRFLESDWEDVWMAPWLELIVGCVLLVCSAAFWNDPHAGALTDLDYWDTNLGAIIGPWFVYRAWKRRHDDPA